MNVTKYSKLHQVYNRTTECLSNIVPNIPALSYAVHTAKMGTVIPLSEEFTDTGSENETCLSCLHQLSGHF